MSEKSTN